MGFDFTDGDVMGLFIYFVCNASYEEFVGVVILRQEPAFDVSEEKAYTIEVIGEYVCVNVECLNLLHSKQ